MHGGILEEVFIFLLNAVLLFQLVFYFPYLPFN